MKILSGHAILLALSAPLLSFPLPSSASVAAMMGVRVGGITQGYSAATTDSNILSVGGSVASLQFRSASNCLGPACLIDGPAVGAYLTGGGQNDSATASLQYFVTLSGGPEAVPVLVSGAYQTVNPDVLPRGGGTDAAAFININTTDPGEGFIRSFRFRFRSECFNYPPELQEENPEMNCGAGTFGGTVTMTENYSLKVSMTAIAFRRHEDSFLGPASAYIDPFFQIDPVFASAHPGYMLTFDPGVGNAPPAGPNAVVPEPGSLALAVAGLTGIVGLRRRSIRDERSPADAVS